MSSASDYLGRAGARETIEDWNRLAPVTYLQTHEAVQSNIDNIYSVVFTDLSRELAEIDAEIMRVDKEIAVWVDRRCMHEEQKADLELVGRIPKDAENSTTLKVIAALEDAKRDLRSSREKILARRSEAVIELEELEEYDFELLQRGL